jgi:hypothetical protein
MLDAEQVDQLYGIFKIYVYKNGLEVQRKKRYASPSYPPIARKGIFEMSKKSKMRLTHIVANCDIKFKSMFTLTYGDFFIPFNGQILKYHLKTLLNALRKRYTVEYVWFVEFTQRDRPHIHVICTIDPNEWDREWLGQRWAKISVSDYWKKILKGDYDESLQMLRPVDEFVVWEEIEKVYRVHSHQKCWEQIRKEDGATRYCFKYAAKSEQKIVPPSFHNIGRFWGTSQGCDPKPIGVIEIGKDCTEDEVKAMFLSHRVGELPLIPKYVLENDAKEYFRLDGVKLSKIIGKQTIQRLP